MMVLAIGAANRDPYLFPEAARFDPARDNSRILTFGNGAHFCLGMHVARRELETALRVIFRRLPDIQLSLSREIEYYRGVVRGPREVWVRPYGNG